MLGRLAPKENPVYIGCLDIGKVSHRLVGEKAAHNRADPIDCNKQICIFGGLLASPFDIREDGGDICKTVLGYSSDGMNLYEYVTSNPI